MSAYQARPSEVCKEVTLKANCTVVCEVTIGKYAMVEAGAVVNRDVAVHKLVVGNPCRQIGLVSECGGWLGEDFKCSECGNFFG